MANRPGTGIPGIATGGFPQWGVGGGTPGSPAGWNIKEATTEAQKLTLSKQGYLVWFSSQSAAQDFINGESNPASSTGPNVPSGLAAIGDFFNRLTSANTWLRVGEVLLGFILVAVGVARVTHAVPIATKVAKTVGAVAI